jgi:hypothetical protein
VGVLQSGEHLGDDVPRGVHRQCDRVRSLLR